MLSASGCSTSNLPALDSPANRARSFASPGLPRSRRALPGRCSILRSGCAEHRLDNTAQQPWPGRVALVCDLLSMVRGMNASSDFPASIGLQVAEHGRGVRVVTVVGHIDALTALELANFLFTQLTVARVVVVDLDGVSLLGSAGLSALFEANELATQQHRALRLVCNSPIANRALAAAGLRESFIVADSVPGALTHPACVRGVLDVAVPRRLRRSRSRRSRRRDSSPTAPAI